MSEQWTTLELGQYCQVKTGKKDVNEGSAFGQFPFFTCSRSISWSDSYSFDTEAILIAGNGDVGNLHYYHGKFEAYQRTYILDSFGIDIQYVYQYLSGNLLNALEKEKIGTSIPYIKLEHLTHFPVYLPVCPKLQNKIASILSTLDQTIEKTKALIEKYQQIKAGLMHDLFTRGVTADGKLRPSREQAPELYQETAIGWIPKEWDLLPLEEIVHFQRGHDIVEAQFEEGEYPVVSSGGIIGYHSEYTTKGPGVVVGRKGTIGKVHYLGTDYWAHDTSLFSTTLFENDSEYVFYLCNWLDLGRFGTKSGSPSLNRNDIHRLAVAHPNIGEQIRIRTRLAACDEKIAMLRFDSTKLSQKKSGLMHDLLTGKVPVTLTAEDKHV